MKRFLITLLTMLMIAGPAAALEYGAGGKISTLGLGVEGSMRLTERWMLRLDYNRLKSAFSWRVHNVRWNLGLQLGAVGGAFDFHPIHDGLLLSLGLYYNRNGVTLHAAPTSDVKIGSRTFTPTEVGSITGKLSYGRIAPYIGVGYDNTYLVKGPWSFGFRTGILFMNRANISLAATGSLANDSGFQADLAQERDALEEPFNAFRFYPVISLFFRYRF